MKSHKFTLFGYEIRIQPASWQTLHVTVFPDVEYIEPEPYRLQFTMDDRIFAMAGNHQFIEYIFRDYDMALFTYREYAAILLEDVMNSLRKIRNTLSERGANEEQLRTYDEKVHVCFERTVNVIKHRAEDENNAQKNEEQELYNTIVGYEIDRYYNGDNWRDCSETNRENNKT